MHASPLLAGYSSSFQPSPLSRLQERLDALLDIVRRCLLALRRTRRYVKAPIDRFAWLEHVEDERHQRVVMLRSLTYPLTG